MPKHPKPPKRWPTNLTDEQARKIFGPKWGQRGPTEKKPQK